MSLLEVLISFNLLTLLFLGFDAVQVKTFELIQSHYDFGVATTQLSNMVEQLRMLQSLPYDTIEKNWHIENRSLLRNSKEGVSGVYPNFKLWIAWDGHQSCSQTVIGKSGCVAISIHLA